ncbi:unnamed protein product [Sphagnum tenellum]
MAGGVFSAAGLKELIAKYGKVALGVHLSVSAASITGCYVAIKNNVDVGAILERVGLFSSSEKEEKEQAAAAATADLQRYESSLPMEGSGDEVLLQTDHTDVKEKNRIHAAAVSGGGALALAFLCNKALIPVRIPITIALTPAVARLLALRNLYRRP